MSEPRSPPPLWRRLLPLVVLLVIAFAVYGSGLHRYASFEALEQHHRYLDELVAARPVASGLGFVLIYAIATAVSIPGAVFLTIAGGFLFGMLWGAALSVTGASIGAIGVFIVARTSLGDYLRSTAAPWLGRMRKGFNENALSYLLVLRIIPLFPFWAVNIVPALLGVELRAYALATVIGIIPGALVFASVGSGLDTVIDRGGEPDLDLILEPAILGPLVGLAVLALLPVVYKRLKARRRADESR
jgi:uncharacterized membrane protein YdjX (TVP38/TMEM64 family)